MVRKRGIWVWIALGVLAASSNAEAAVWGGFDGTRVNYPGGVLADGADHDSLRGLIEGAGDTLATPTPTLTAAYLGGVDVFYTSLLGYGMPSLAPGEQQALQHWVADGGTLIVTGDIFPVAAYESFTAPFGVAGWTQTFATTATAAALHPLMAGVSMVDPTTQSTFSYVGGVLPVAVADDGNVFAVVLEADTGFCLGGRVLVLGDHNLFTDNAIGEADNIQLAANMVAWAGGAMTSCSLCGNGVLDGAELCDDGNVDDADACLSTCQPAACGDGVVWLGVEECDDGNGDDSDACSNACETAVCGDGVLQSGVESCDDGNDDDDDVCPGSCQPATCGDGFLWAGVEECDDGNDDDSDECPGSCQPAMCGDGFVWLGVEECDDGNDDDFDACSNACVLNEGETEGEGEDEDEAEDGSADDEGDTAGDDDGHSGTSGGAPGDPAGDGGSTSDSPWVDEDEPLEKGCGCSADPRSTPTGLWLGLLSLWGLRRRRAA